MYISLCILITGGRYTSICMSIEPAINLFFIIMMRDYLFLSKFSLVVKISITSHKKSHRYQAFVTLNYAKEYVFGRVKQLSDI